MKTDKPKTNHTFSVVLSLSSYSALKRLAESESRTIAQMARVLIERAVKGERK